MRYIWGMQEAYAGRGPKRLLYEAMAVPLRPWDRRTARRVDRFVAISEYVRTRITRAYGRNAEVIYPPVDTGRFQPAGEPQAYFLVVSALVPYKRVDIVLDSFQDRSDELWVVGSGPLLRRYRSRSAQNIRLLGFVDDTQLADLVAGCRALIFPTEDEFGITAVEAQAAGRPVIALGRGGAAETVIPPERGARPTGVWFSEQTPQALASAIRQFQEIESSFDPKEIRAHALAFSPERFRAELLRVIEDLVRRPRVPGGPMT
jgi:glycosyltransferase involved in cell wall biosynthesis